MTRLGLFLKNSGEDAVASFPPSSLSNLKYAIAQIELQRIVLPGCSKIRTLSPQFLERRVATSFIPPLSNVVWPDESRSPVSLPSPLYPPGHRGDWTVPRPPKQKYCGRQMKPLKPSQLKGVERTLRKYSFIEKVQRNRLEQHRSSRNLVVALYKKRQEEKRRQQRVSDYHDKFTLKMMGLAGLFRAWAQLARRGALIRKKVANIQKKIQASCFRAWCEYIERTKGVRRLAFRSSKCILEKSFEAWAEWANRQDRIRSFSARYLAASDTATLRLIVKEWRRVARQAHTDCASVTGFGGGVTKAPGDVFELRLRSKARVAIGAWYRRTRLVKTARNHFLQSQRKNFKVSFNKLARNQTILGNFLRKRSLETLIRAFRAWKSFPKVVRAERLSDRVQRPSAFFVGSRLGDKGSRGLGFAKSVNSPSCE